MSKDEESFREEEEEVTAGESEILRDLWKGVVAGLAGAVAVAIAIFAKDTIGFLPQVDAVALLANMIGFGGPVIGWAVLFAGGGVLGIAFASLDAHVGHVTGAGEIAHGVLFGVLLWIALMLMIVPVYMEESFFVIFAVAVLASNILFGVVMGVVYGAMNPEEVPEA